MLNVALVFIWVFLYSQNCFSSVKYLPAFKGQFHSVFWLSAEDRFYCTVCMYKIAVMDIEKWVTLAEY